MGEKDFGRGKRGRRSTHHGRFKPVNPKKYVGDPTNIQYRSGWELRVMKFMDTSESVICWNSEEVVVRYLSPVDARWHRYYPDFVAKVRTRDGSERVSMIEVKPSKETAPPKALGAGKKPTKRMLSETRTWAVNRAKWDAALAFCAERGWAFELLTEKTLFARR